MMCDREHADRLIMVVSGEVDCFIEHDQHHLLDLKV
jgi:hypothetical protein